MKGGRENSSYHYQYFQIFFFLMHTSPILNTSLGLRMEKTGNHFLTQVLLAQTPHRWMNWCTHRAQPTLPTFWLAQKALAVCPATSTCNLPKELCAPDTTDKGITNIQTASPSALCDFPTHSLKALTAASLWGQTGWEGTKLGWKSFARCQQIARIW